MIRNSNNNLDKHTSAVPVQTLSRPNSPNGYKYNRINRLPTPLRTGPAPLPSIMMGMKNGQNNLNRKKRFLPWSMYRKKFFRDNINLNLKKHCFIYIKQTFNNTFITVKNKKKKLLLTKSCGAIGFKGKKRSAYYASIQLAKRVRTLVRKIKKTASVILLSKPTKHVKLIISNLSNKFDLKIKEIVERIPVTHNGLRKSHVRRK